MDEINEEKERIINVINHVKSKYNGEENIIVGQMEDGKLVLHVGGSEIPVSFQTLFIPEDALVGLLATLIAYIRQNDIDLPKKTLEYFNGKPMEYVYASEKV